MNNIGKHALAYLTPGLADLIKYTANNSGNMAWHGLAQATQIFRNALYVTTPAVIISANKEDKDRSMTRIGITSFLFMGSAVMFGKSSFECAKRYQFFADAYIKKDLPKFLQSDLKVRTAAVFATTIVFSAVYLVEYGLEQGVKFASKKAWN